MDNENENVQFENQEIPQSPLAPGTESGASKMALWLMSHSRDAIKTEKQADIVLLVFSILAIAVSIYWLFGGSRANVSVNAIPANAPLETVNQ